MLPWKERKKRILMDESSQLISDNFENIRWQTTRAEPVNRNWQVQPPTARRYPRIPVRERLPKIKHMQ